ncbi:Gfo/Idh/MocA family oxidoreductase [Ponticoccus sp. SC2-23]|uniref:Gfo/Idh/MocA family protein n=1 Tax=Alexandriicola marinus TaxID=2081710 RepID=UPI000FD8BFD2|nr:Gfo/Idh/MocA family oxidoreductase [Alexandriicola marinus]MBM1221656.1 Gfo/Idh/MocA family oxidoreductase [Ponticoccus sp. SC6-9]MBM1226697.1 Gfo/Idh/MocA family oxidoreductase [Ponticoccus sp. SC6-15]MBM1230648.1 Gfo/Idh/MocA family oxidoreductase [Ponticoccus sp. SC6-38]MBM1235171.1 Gfo/Idh/MocA family oxidoreductase [Ponticoccus sp. SC6-45]MBM1239669.1 Gfo/Idh/MocA family oxidoreductase [Ponticoccus sp. SC6-49]MBM1243451.1 Gfo/Idh/MocA family oxidoreductase [Ponticoccus sp. SC2-64]MBM
MSEADTDTYALRAAKVAEIAAPDIAYQPPSPRDDSPRIGLIGAGGISVSHLDACRTAGWNVTTICNRTLSKAEDKAARFYPQARVTDDWATVLADPEIDVVDITPYPAARLPIIEAALEAGKHVLSQKPFVTSLDDGERLVALAEAKGVKLAVNQNGRWSPHHAWMRGAVRGGHLGTLRSAHVSIGWDHSWIKGTPFEDIDDLILYDFGVHWFDFLVSIAGDRIRRVSASTARAAGQTPRPPLLAQALVELDDGQASLVFDGATPHGPRDTTQITGTDGSLSSIGESLGEQVVTLTTAEGRASPTLTGTWFNDGFRGAMGELLCAIEEDREPGNGARENLQSLALCFAAIESSRTGRPVDIGAVRHLPGDTP